MSDDKSLPEDRSRRALLRILDANRNRALEALRVVEEHARFVLSTDELARRTKELRHRLHLALPLPELPLHRDVAQDPLAPGSPASEAPGVRAERRTSEDVARANLSRAKEALRALEEYAKPVAAESAPELERIRYSVYALERDLVTAAASQERLRDLRVYLILEEKDGRPALEEQARRALEGGVRLFQLRDKRSPDRERVARARALAELVHREGGLLLVNDRADVAALARADGVHVGQDDLSVRDARALLPSGTLVGASAHDEPELARALEGGPDYVGIGTVFASPTKPELRVRGLETLRALAPRSPVPVYAIGGIDAENAPQAIEAGAFGVAVSSSVLDAKDVAVAAARLVLAVAEALGKRA